MTAPVPRAYYEQSEAAWLALLERVRDLPRTGRLLLRGATVVTVDPQIGDFDRGDVLIKDGLIEAVGPDLSAAAGDAQTLQIELGGMIVMPGIVDAHRHCWQNQFRRLIPDADIQAYLETTLAGFALAYEPADMFAGTLLTILGLLDAGVTTVLDYAHNGRTAAHADAVFRAYSTTGTRVVHISSAPSGGPWDEHWPEDLVRLHNLHGSSPDTLTTVRMGIDINRVRPLPDLLAYARDRQIGITFDGVVGARCGEVAELGEAGLLGPDVTLIHCTAMPDDGWRHIAESGVGVTLATTSDQQIPGLGDGLPPIQKALDYGIRPSLSGDVEICLAGDMFTQMRTTLTTQRMLSWYRQYHNDTQGGSFLSARDVIEFATAQAAQDVGLGKVTGTLTPGKAADLIAIRACDINNMPLNNAAGTIVHGTESKNVDMVFVSGVVKKWRGVLLDQDVDDLRRLVAESRDRVAAKAGFEVRPTWPVKIKKQRYDDLESFASDRGTS